MSKRKFILAVIAFIGVVTISFTSLQKNEAKPFHTPAEKEFFKKITDQTTRIELDSGQCCRSYKLNRISKFKNLSG